jgi:hypothetical protein
MLELMLPALAQAPTPVQTPPAPVQTPVQTRTAPAKPQRVRVQAPVPDPEPVVANEFPVVGAPLVAVVNAPVVVQHVAVQNVVPETPMEVEDEDTILERLFFKRFGRALPKTDEKEKEDEVDKIKFVIDLTDESDEMEVAAPVPVAVVKTEPIETPEIVANVNNVNNVNSVYNESGIRVSRRLELIELAKARKAINEFGKSLRKTAVIPEKEPDNIIADTDSDMSEDTSIHPESVTTVNSVKTVEQAIAETDAAIAANRKDLDEFDN